MIVSSHEVGMNVRGLHIPGLALQTTLGQADLSTVVITTASLAVNIANTKGGYQHGG